MLYSLTVALLKKKKNSKKGTLNGFTLCAISIPPDSSYISVHHNEQTNKLHELQIFQACLKDSKMISF